MKTGKENLISTRVLMLKLNKFEGSVRNHEMMGSMHPSCHRDIEQAFVKHRKKLIEYFVTLLMDNEAITRDASDAAYNRGVKDGMSRASNERTGQDMGR